MSETHLPSYPVLPLRDIVVFPHMIVPLFVGREKSVRALEEVMADDKQILLSSQIDPSDDDPDTDGIYKAGVLANVLQLLKLPDGTVKVLVEGRARVRITDYLDNDDYFEAHAAPLTELPGDQAAVVALVRSVGEEFERYAKVKKNIPEEALAAVSETREPATAGRPRRRPSRHRGGPEAGASGNPRRRRAAGEGLWPDAGRDVGPAGREEDQDPRQDADGAHPARILSERADEGHPEGTGRRRGRPERGRRAGRADRARRSSPRRRARRPMPS